MTRGYMHSALMRGLFHTCTGLIIVAIVLLASRLVASLVLAAAAAGLLTLDLARLRLPAVNQRFLRWFAPLMRDREETAVTGSSYYLVGSAITAAAFPGYIAAPAILFMAVGDPFAALVGIREGRVRFWGKSMEGHLACLAACLVCGWIMATIHDDLTLAVAFIGAIIATFVQALPLQVNDNITMPVGAAAVMAIANIFW